MARGSLGAGVLVAAGLLAGCGHADVHEVVLRGGEPPTERPPELYFEKRLPTRPFYEIALLQVVGYGDESDIESLSKAISGRASDLGCDAVVRLHVDHGYARSHAYGVCVKYTETASVSPWRPVSPAPPPTATAPATPPAPPPSEPSPEEPAPPPDDAGF